ncbi:MAG TPA: hypothetical protein VKZ18_25320 [Polyangia bacterium]|nr:hypothetical protein [Polyangia bacterium]
MNGSSRARFAALAAAIIVGSVAPLGCADMFQREPGPATASTAGPRTAPDDSDLWNLAPASADLVAEVDLAALRASPWSKSLMASDVSGQREEGRRLYGYDVFSEADRLLEVVSEAGGTPHSLTIVRGTFDPARVGAAFTAAAPGATADRWRESPIWEGGGQAVALVTPRTLAEGDPGSVRAAIDAAWGVVPDARTVPLGAVRRSLDADHGGPAAFIAFNVTDSMRARASGVGVDLPPGLALGAARVDLGDDLNVEVTGTLDTPPNALAAAAAGTVAARAYAQNTMVRLLGLAPVLAGVTFGAEGTHVHGHLRIPAERREGLADKLLAVLQMVAAARH